MCDIARMEHLSHHIAARPGRTLSEWAEALGISRPYLHGLMAGTRQPSLTTAQRIATATAGEVPITAWPTIAAVVAAARGPV